MEIKVTNLLNLIMGIFNAMLCLLNIVLGVMLGFKVLTVMAILICGAAAVFCIHHGVETKETNDTLSNSFDD